MIATNGILNVGSYFNDEWRVVSPVSANWWASCRFIWLDIGHWLDSSFLQCRHQSVVICHVLPSIISIPIDHSSVHATSQFLKTTYMETVAIYDFFFIFAARRSDSDSSGICQRVRGGRTETLSGPAKWLKNGKR